MLTIPKGRHEELPVTSWLGSQPRTHLSHTAPDRKSETDSLKEAHARFICLDSPSRFRVLVFSKASGLVSESLGKVAWGVCPKLRHTAKRPGSFSVVRAAGRTLGVSFRFIQSWAHAHHQPTTLQLTLSQNKRYWALFWVLWRCRYH